MIKNKISKGHTTFQDLTSKKTETLNRPITGNKSKVVKLPTNKSPEPDSFEENSTKHLKK